MSDALDFTWDAAGERYLKARAEAPQALARELERVLDLYGLEFTTRTIVRKRLSGRKDGDKGLYRREGDLADSARHQVLGSGSVASLGVQVFIGGSAARYARVHEEGATIKAKERVVHVQRESKRFGVRTFAYRRALLSWRGEYGKWRGKWTSKKEVVIPPRLEFKKTFADDGVRRKTLLFAALLRVIGGGSAPAPAAEPA